MSETESALRPQDVAPIPLRELLSGLARTQDDRPVTGICLDSRQVHPGDLYVGLPGTKTHGASFASHAIAAGAVAVLTDEDGVTLAGNVAVPIACCDDPRLAMAEAAARLYGHPALRMMTFGITGTNGKSTTVSLLASGLAACGRRVGTVGTLGFAIDGEQLESSRTTVTTPESVDLQAMLAYMAERGTQALAMEVSSHALALHRTTGIVFDVAGFTNLGRDHLDFHRTMEEYFEVKARLFTPRHAKAAVINADDDHGRVLLSRAAELGVPAVGYGTSEGADYRIIDWRPAGAGARFTLETKDASREIQIALPGEYNVRNATCALAMLEQAGFDIEVAASGMRGAVVEGRMEPVALGPDAPHVYVDFAHTPQAISSALGALAPVREAGHRVFVVVGAGGDRDAAKRPLMGRAAAQGADVVLITDDNPRTEDPAPIRRAVVAGAKEAEGCAAEVIDAGPRREAIARAFSMARPGDAIAILGKGHEKTQIIGTEPVPFDDVAVAVEEWENRENQ